MPLLDLDLYRTEVSVSIAPRVRLSVVDAGPRDAEHTILFLHGFGGHALQWEKQLAAFAEKYRVVAPDLRGHGLSDYPDSAYTMQELVGDLERIAEQLHLPKQFVVIGHSFGGAIAASFTVRNPTRVEKLILIGTATSFRLGMQSWLTKLPVQFFEPLRPYLPVHYHAPLFVMKRMYANNVAAWDGTLVLPQVRVPTLIILGVRDLVYEKSRYEQVADLIPGAQLAKIPVSAHMVQLERSDAVNRAIQRFIGGESVSWREGRRAENLKLFQTRPWLLHYEDGVPYTLNYPTQPLFRFLDIAARRFPFRTATTYYDSTLSYRGLRRQANRFANALRELGIQKGERVALVLPNCPQYVVGYYGAMKAGAIVVNINPQSDERELKHHLQDSGARVVVALDELYPLLSEFKTGSALEYIILTGLTEYVSAVFRSAQRAQTRLPNAPLLNQTLPPGVHRFQALLDKATKETPLVDVAPEDVALIQYSTGTTDFPKGVMLTHANLIANTMQLRHWLPDVTEGQERILTVLPLTHSYAMTTCMNFAISIAGAMVLLPDLRTGMMLEAIRRTRPSIFPGVPNVFLAINHFPNARRFGVESIRACLSGAAPLPLEVQEAFEKITRGRLVEGYGLTEASPVTHANPIFGDSVPGTIGVPLPDTEAKIVDMNAGGDLATGQVGELMVRGPQVMKGYWQNDMLTSQTLRDGWLATGDLARMDEEGYFQFIDRKSDLITKNGQTIFPRDIEEVLFEHPLVNEAAAVGIPTMGDPQNERIKAYVVPKRGEKPAAADILNFARSRLPALSVPDEIEFRSDLPKTFIGKVFKRKLLEQEKRWDRDA